MVFSNEDSARYLLDLAAAEEQAGNSTAARTARDAAEFYIQADREGY